MLYFLVAVGQLSGLTLDALGAARSVGEVGDPVQIYFLPRRHSGCNQRARGPGILWALDDVAFIVLCRTKANSSVSEAIALLTGSHT